MSSTMDLLIFTFLWSRRGDLNPGPTDYESVALPLSYAGIYRKDEQGFDSYLSFFRMPVNLR